MFSPFLEIWQQVKAMKPAFISKSPHFNFMTLHYFYIIALAITGSICLFPRGDIAYIDALFLSSGSATQSGLNTVNLNDINTWQQLALYFLGMLGNPITINSFVVFLRLYWFEKEFQEVAKKSNKARRTMSFARSFSKSKTHERDLDGEERGVGNRNITVLHDDTDPNVTNGQDLGDKLGKTKSQDRTRSSNETGENSTGQSSTLDGDQNAQPQIKFADQVKRSDGMSDGTLRMPGQRSEEEHIAILQRQRNPSDNAVLRIPGPRDADAGIAPEEVNSDDVVLDRIVSRNSNNDDNEADPAGANGNRPARRGITIQEPDRRHSPPPAHPVVEDAVAVKHAFSAIGGLHRRTNKNTTNKAPPGPGVRKRSNTFNSIKRTFTKDAEKDDGIVPYLSWQPTIGRNSIFVDLSEDQREELGGIEYRSLKTLAKILILYSVGFHGLGVIGLVPWILDSAKYGSVVTSAGQGRVWWAFFTASSAFTDLGFTLTPDSMISFQAATWPLFLMTFLIIIGNTGFPIMLRVIIWVTSKWVPSGSGIYEEVRFLLDHPRRCFTLLFPGNATWWLLGILVVLNAVDLIFFIILDFGNSVVTDLTVRTRVLDGWFQAVSTRTAGFGVVDLSKLHPAIQVSYLVMMYISVLPIAISVRRTNVYEEKSLGLYGSPGEEAEDENSKEPSYVGSHLRRQLSFDLWYIFLGFFIICIAEGGKIQNNPSNFTMFGILFEIVSAYGTVGLSLGFPNTNTSLSAQFTVLSKLVIIAMQIRGRHRGLPYALDKAIMLPNARLEQEEQAHAEERLLRRRSSIASHTTSLTGFPSAEPVMSGGGTARGRSRSTRQQAQNIFENLMHIGPSLPESHRNLRKQQTNVERQRTYSMSQAQSPDRKARSVSPRHLSGTYGIPLNEMAETVTGPKTRKRASSGRRKFDPADPSPPTLQHADSESTPKQN